MSDLRARPVVVFSGGGTGGHLYPALALSEALEGLRPDVASFFIGARRGVEARVLPARGLPHLLLEVEGLPRGPQGVLRRTAASFGALAKLMRALGQLARELQLLRPSMVVVTGGYAGGPAGILASLLGLPLVLQEQNSVPGLTTRLLALRAREIHLAFPEARARLPRPARRRARISGNPVRPPLAVDRVAAARHFGVDPDAPVVLVVGGSQGSAALNRGVLELLQARHGEPLSGGGSLLWATGPTHLATVEEALATLGSPSWVRPVGYIEAMGDALALADVAVSRAGAMATSEFLAWGIPAVLVPLPTAAADHQTVNARALAEAGAALLLPESRLGADSLAEALEGLLADPRRRAAMAGAARARGRPSAAVEIAASLERLLPRPWPRPAAHPQEARDA